MWLAADIMPEGSASKKRGCMKNWTNVTRMVAVTALVAGGLVGTGTAAQAAPTNCNSSTLANGYWVFCGSGSGEYRAAITCWYNNGASSRNRFGPWRLAGALPSEVSCTSSEELGGYWIEKRG
ncbi:hypothetical protein ABUL04_02935 [Micromonospora harpali]|uniref:Chitin-binding type-3 domain-containing protein n=1 Tax=Micromonospora harpali TaxID=1490225 RepID=A0ABW1HVX1_9ACTN|nr:hypothetical protein [Micromonospora sp. DH15]